GDLAGQAADVGLLLPLERGDVTLFLAGEARIVGAGGIGRGGASRARGGATVGAVPAVDEVQRDGRGGDESDLLLLLSHRCRVLWERRCRGRRRGRRSRWGRSARRGLRWRRARRGSGGSAACRGPIPVRRRAESAHTGWSRR